MRVLFLESTNMKVSAARVASRFLSATRIDPHAVLQSFVGFLEKSRSKVKIEREKDDHAGPWATTSNSTLKYSVWMSPWLETVADPEGTLDVLAVLIDHNATANKAIAEALGIKNASLVSYSGVHNRNGLADFELLDEMFFAWTQQKVWQN